MRSRMDALSLRAICGLLMGCAASAAAQVDPIPCPAPRTLGLSAAGAPAMVAAKAAVGTAVATANIPKVGALASNLDRGFFLEKQQPSLTDFGYKQVVPPLDGFTDGLSKIPTLPISPEERLRQTSAAQCNAAAIRFLREFQLARNRIDGLDGMALAAWLRSSYKTPESLERLKPLAEAMSRYDAECLSAAPAPPQLAELVGVFAIDGVQICTGYRIGPDTVLTARHCFYDRVTNSLWPAVAKGRVWFSYPKAGQQLFEVCEERPGLVTQDARQFSVLEDYITVKIAGNHPPTPQVATYVGDVPAGADLRLYALFPDLALLGEDHTGMHLRWSNRGGCIAYLIHGSCIVHGCQSAQGSSGAPLFVVTGDQLQFAGIHVDSVDAGSSVCPTAPLPGATYNLGIRVSTSSLN